MRAAAQLDRAARTEHPNDVAVLVAEEGDCARGECLVLRGLERVDTDVGEDFPVREVLDAADLFRGDRGVMAEVEAETVGRHHGTGLLHVLAENRSQCPVKNVGARVVASGRAPLGDIDDRGHRGTFLDLAAHGAADVASQTRECIRRVDDFDLEIGRVDAAVVADLATALCIEGSVVEEDLDGAVVTGHDREHGGLRGVMGVAHEIRGAVLLHDLAVRLDTVLVGAPGLAGVLRAAALFLHLGLESGNVDIDTALPRDLLGQLQRESVGVVQEERGRTRQGLWVLLHVVLEDGQSGLQRVTEPFLLLREDTEDEVLVAVEVGVRIPHDLDGRLGE